MDKKNLLALAVLVVVVVAAGLLVKNEVVGNNQTAIIANPGQIQVRKSPCQIAIEAALSLKGAYRNMCWPNPKPPMDGPTCLNLRKQGDQALEQASVVCQNNPQNPLASSPLPSSNDYTVDLYNSPDLVCKEVGRSLGSYQPPICVKYVFCVRNSDGALFQTPMEAVTCPVSGNGSGAVVQ